MVKRILLLFTILYSVLTSAQQTDSISHKNRMINAINRGKFNEAIESISYVKDWSFDWNQENELIDIDASLSFLEYADSMHLSIPLMDSLSLYTARTSEMFGYNYHTEGDYHNALLYQNITVDIYRLVLGKNHPDYAIAVNVLGLLHSKIGNYLEAEKYYLEALNICANILGKDHPTYATLLNNLGGLYNDVGNYLEAEKYYLEALSICANILGKDHPTYATLLNNLGGLYDDVGNYLEAEKYYLEALKIRESILGKNHPGYIISLNNLAYLYSSIGNNIEAEKYYLEALSICANILGKDHPTYATLLNNLGGLYDDVGNYSEAEKYYLEALKIRESILGKNHQDCGALMSDLGDVYVKMGDNVRAEKYYLEALSICASILGKDHPTYATLLNNLGGIYLDVCNYSEAEKYYLEALKIRESILGEEHLDYVASLIHMGGTYYIMGDYTKAEEYSLKASSILNSVHCDSHSDYAASLNALGILYLDMGDYDTAEKLCLEANNIWRSIYGENHSVYAWSLNSLGKLYLEMGAYLEAEKYTLEALKIRESILGKNHLHYVISLNDVGNVYSTMGEFSKAEKYHLEAVNCFKNILGETHPDYATSLNNLGVLYSNMGDYSKAEPYYLESLRIRKSVLGESHPSYASSLNNIGVLYSNMGDYSKAESYFLESLRIRKSILGETHPDYANSLNNLGILYSSKGDYAKAESYYLKTSQIKKDLFLQSTNFMTEQQREHYWKTMRQGFTNNYAIFCYKYNQHKPSISTFAYNNELFVKGLLLTSSESVKRSIVESNDTTLINQWNELTTKKQQIQVLQEKDPQSNYLKQVQSEAEQLEKQITRSSAAYRENQAMWQITWDSVQNHLFYNEVAIEYFSAPLSKDSTMYCALLLRHDSKYPELIPLFEEKEISSYLSSTNTTYDFYANGAPISQLVWSKILPKINEGETIYFAPSGLLHQLAIEYLPYDENRTMSDVYNMVRLSSTREIVLNKQDTEYTTATLYGGIAYDLEEDVLLAESENYAKENLLASRSIENDTLNRGNVKYLPGTKKEAETINALLTQNNISANLYTTSKANEESFKSLSGKHNNIIHIGTHGFTWTDSTARKQDYFTQRMQLQTLDGNNHLATPTIDPLTRCGLLFAGSNIALSGHSSELPDGVQDGILTAKEISLMDLRDADLVVLSACETAKGDITSEGVFGLQRAFKMAGVQTIIMSLWKVNDQATQLLMTEFYNNWIGKHQSKREAFRNAQNAVRTQYEEPVYWAGFIMLD